LVEDIVELDHNPWSGHSALMGKVKREWQDTDFVTRFVASDKKPDVADLIGDL
jgi:hypothetical protein